MKTKMKTIKTMLMLCSIAALLLSGCKKDDGDTESYAFSLNRPEASQQGAVGYQIEFGLSVVAAYDLSSVPMTFTVGGDISKGTLTIDGDTVYEAEVYPLATKNPIFRYTAKEEGQHQLAFTFRNNHEEAKKAIVIIEVGKGDFTVSNEAQPEGELWQGMEYFYDAKITPVGGAPSGKKRLVLYLFN